MYSRVTSVQGDKCRGASAYCWCLVKVYDGRSQSSPLLGTFSGAVLPPPVVAASTAMRITFTSDGSVEGEGFVASFAFGSWNGLAQRRGERVKGGQDVETQTIAYDSGRAEELRSLGGDEGISSTEGVQ